MTVKTCASEPKTAPVEEERGTCCPRPQRLPGERLVTPPQSQTIIIVLCHVCVMRPPAAFAQVIPPLHSKVNP